MQWMINAHAVTMKHVTTLEACVLGISSQTSHFFSGLDSLLSGHFSLIASLLLSVKQPKYKALPMGAVAYQLGNTSSRTITEVSNIELG